MKLVLLVLLTDLRFLLLLLLLLLPLLFLVGCWLAGVAVSCWLLAGRRCWLLLAVAGFSRPLLAVLFVFARCGVYVFALISLQLVVSLFLFGVVFPINCHPCRSCSCSSLGHRCCRHVCLHCGCPCGSDAVHPALISVQKLGPCCHCS